MQFSDIVGQAEIKNQLINDFHHDKISHALLLLGNPGFGSLPLVLAYVQFLFCTNKQDNDSCGHCANCKKIAILQHPDVNFTFPVVQAESKISDGFIKQWREQVIGNPYFDLNEWITRIDDRARKPIIGTEESQEIIKKLSLKSFEGGYKVTVIWMAEEMNPSCANKLLKILEEPPEKTLFFLIVNSTDLLLPTIISRTRLTKIHRISMEALSEYLSSAKGLSKTRSLEIAAQSDGDLIRANELMSSENDRDVNRDEFVKFMRVCYKKNVVGMLDWAEGMASNGKENQKQFVTYCLRMFHQSMLKNYTEDQLTRVTNEEEQFLKNFARFITGNNIFDFTKHFNQAYYYLDRNANPKILFTELAFKVMRYIHFA